MKAWKSVFLILFLLVAIVSAKEEELNRPLTLTPVGNVVPGKAPLAISVVSGDNPHVLIGNYRGKRLKSWDLEDITGNITAEGTARVQKGISDITTTKINGRTYVYTANIALSDVGALRLDAGTGALSPIGNVSSGGVGPVALDVAFSGGQNFICVANRDSANLGVFRLDRGGALSPIGSTPLPPDPIDLKATGNQVIVGTSPGIVALGRVEPNGFVTPLDAENLGQQITAMAVRGNRLAVGTTLGDVWTYKIGTTSLNFLQRNELGKGFISDLTFSKKSTLFAVGGDPGWLAAYKFPKSGSLSLRAEFSLTGQSTRTIATVKGDEKGETFVIMNEFHLNQTQVFRAKR